jgi:riboflavin kinase / FMN adenylyltransferase
MQLLQSYRNVPASARHGVLTIGNFDGVHLGHAAVIGQVLELANQLGGPAGAMLFDPHPRAYFQPDKPLFTLTPLRLRLGLLAGLRLDFAAVLPFNDGLASLSAEDFIADVLVAGFAVRHVVVGYDFNFGKGRRGDAAMLTAVGARHGFGVTIQGAAGDHAAPYSSSRIRDYLRHGDVEAASRLLGRPWRIEGTVISGAGRGVGLGFPTANIALPPGIELKHGIYASWVWVDGVRHPAASYLGTRPTFDNGAPVFETFLIDFDGDLYGRSIEIDLVAYLRGDLPFAGVEALKLQMQADCAAALGKLRAVAAP